MSPATGAPLMNGNGAPGVKPGRVIDLDRAKAARAEAAGEPVTVILGGQEFTLPVEMPAEFVFLADAGDIREAVAVLLGDSADEFFATSPSIDDIGALVEHVGQVYGVSPGEARASANS